MVKASKRKLVVEGGGYHNAALEAECRKAFTRLQESAGLKGRMAQVVVAGDRRKAYERFCYELAARDPDDAIWLLVDAEEPVTSSDVWKHVATRVGDGWSQPDGATEDHLHFMSVLMETWLLADPKALLATFGRAFVPTALPAWPDLEAVPKADVYTAIRAASGRDRNAYDKGRHSFKALAAVDATTLEGACSYAKRLFTSLRR